MKDRLTLLSCATVSDDHKIIYKTKNVNNEYFPVD